MKPIHLTSVLMCGMALFQNPLSAQVQTSVNTSTDTAVPPSAIEVQTSQDTPNVYYTPESNVQVYGTPGKQSLERKEVMGVEKREGIQYGKEGMGSRSEIQSVEHRDNLNTVREGEVKSVDKKVIKPSQGEHTHEAGHQMNEHSK